jgi:UDP-glucuronate 4-epimerase
MDYISAIETRLGKTAEKIFLPMQPGDVPRTEADVTDLIEDMGYKPNTKVEVGIGRFLEWYTAFYEGQTAKRIAKSTVGAAIW